MKTGLLPELGRRRIWRVAVLYVVGAWAVLQVADLAFPGLNVPERSIRYVWIATIACFPLAMLLGWFYDIRRGSIVRTSSGGDDATRSLRRGDLAIIGATLTGAVAICAVAIASIIASISTQSLDMRDDDALAKSIAILPFENMSGDDRNDAFTLGIHDDLLTHIAKISDIKVISRTSVIRLDNTIGIRDIGRLLNVATVLEGAVQRAGNRLRINAQLIDASTDQHLWAESFDRELTTADIFDIQTEIAAAIAGKLSATLSPQDKASLEQRPTADFQAYEAYLRGKQRLISRRGDDLRRAVDDFQTAIRLDPGYTLAHVGLAEAYLLLDSWGHIDQQEALAVAAPALATALAQNDDSAPANAVQGLLQLRRFDQPRARYFFERAISLDPNLTSAHHWLGDMLINTGEPDQAIPHLERARSLDPLSPVVTTTLGEAYMAVGRFNEAVTLFKKTIETDPDYPGAYFLLGTHAQFVDNDMPAAVDWYRRELAADPQRSTTALAGVYLELGDDIEAERWIDRGLRLQPNDFFGLTAKLFLHRFRDEQEQAVMLARRLNNLAAGNNGSIYVLVSNGRFEEVLRDYARYLPGLNCKGELQVHRRQMFEAMNYSLALEKTGQVECARRILNALLGVIDGMPRDGIRGYGFLEVEIYARLGDTRRAIDTLRGVIADGRVATFWLQVLDSPHTESLRGNAELGDIASDVRRKLQQQLEAVKELDRRGELVHVPAPVLD